MTQLGHNWYELMAQRDATYLGLLFAVVVGYSWYRLWLRKLFVYVAVLAGVVVGAALVWGGVVLGG